MGSYGYDAFNSLTSRSGQYALNSWQSDTATYTNNRRNGWSYNAEGQVTSSTDTSDVGGSSTRTWTYDARGNLAVSAELRNGQTTTLAFGYDGDGELMNELFNGTAADYMVRSSVLGTLLTKLTATGGKDITYVPTNGLAAAMQYQNPGFTPYVTYAYRDALGIQASGQAY
jgi:YD repeat-containing protein